MTLKEALGELEALSNETMLAHNIKHGAGNKLQFGVKMGDIRTVAKKIKKNHALALELWNTAPVRSLLESGWAFTEIILCLKAVPHLLPLYGSTKWYAGKGEKY